MSTLGSVSSTPPAGFWRGFDKVASSPLNTGLGIFWGVLVLDSAARLTCNTVNCFSGDGPSCSQFGQNTFNFVSVSTNTLYWADSVEVISLGEFALTFVKTLGYGASAAIAAFGIADAIADLSAAWTLIESKETEEAGYLKRNKAIFSLVYRISTLCLAILGIVTVIVGVPFFHIWNTGLFLVSFFSYLNAEGICQTCPRMKSTF